MAKSEKAEQTETPTGNDAIAAALLKIAEMAAKKDAGITSDQLETILESTAKSTRKALKPESESPEISVFNPQGERDNPRPRLKRKTYWAGAELHADELNREEIELFNAVEHTVEARNGSWRAELKRTGADGSAELHVSFPCRNNDDRMDLPSMTLMMRELLGGTRAVDPASLAQQVEELRKQLAGMQATA